MAIHIQTGRNNIQVSQRDAKIQRLPCKIHADCDAEVSKFFEPSVKKNADGFLEGSFRGYPLKGQKVNLPQGYKGIVLHETLRPDTEMSERKLYVIHEFNTIINWNWDKIPSKDDPLVSALDWIDISEALHSPVSE